MMGAGVLPAPSHPAPVRPGIATDYPVAGRNPPGYKGRSHKCTVCQARRAWRPPRQRPARGSKGTGITAVQFALVPCRVPPASAQWSKMVKFQKVSKVLGNYTNYAFWKIFLSEN